jgi:hypothetical protein
MEQLMGYASLFLLLVVPGSATAMDKDARFQKGPPPRFITVTKVDLAKREVHFDVEVVHQDSGEELTVLVYPDGSRRLTLGTKPSHTHLGGFKVSLKHAKWQGINGKDISPVEAAKRLKLGIVVLLSADGAAVNQAFLRMFKDDTLVLIVPVDELPLPYLPYTGSTIPEKKVDER